MKISSYCRNEVCESNQTYKMCPLCDENIGCPYWYLSDVCLYTKVAYLFDHPATVFYAVFVSFWGRYFKPLQGSHMLEKYLNIEGFLEKSLKSKYALKSTEKIMQRPLKVLEFFYFL